MQHIITLLGKIMEVSAKITMKGAYDVHYDWYGHVKKLRIEVRDKQTQSTINAAADLYVHDPEDNTWAGDPTDKLKRLLFWLENIYHTDQIPDLPTFTNGVYSAGVVNLIAEREEVEA